jgi:hypothetical protein
LKRGKKRKLTVAQILALADAHHRRTGTWPCSDSGPVAGRPGETWRAFDHALYDGLRGLTAGSSLARLLAKERGKRNPGDLPRLTIKQILAWVDAHHRETGRWPGMRAGPVASARGETWRILDEALRYGYRSLPGGSSLARLLAKYRGVPNRLAKRHLTRTAVLRWADAHQHRTGGWPNSKSGPVVDGPGETWKGVNEALRYGWRGLRRGLSLAQLLARARRARNRANLPRFTERQILQWADDHYQLAGVWPSHNSGPVSGAPGETWGAVDQALGGGYRGLRGGSSLAQLLNAKRRGPKTVGTTHDARPSHNAVPARDKQRETPKPRRT